VKDVQVSFMNHSTPVSGRGRLTPTPRINSFQNWNGRESGSTSIIDRR